MTLRLHGSAALWALPLIAGCGAAASAGAGSTIAPIPTGIVDCYVQPVADLGHNDVLEVQGPGAGEYCFGLGASWSGVPTPATGVPACTLVHDSLVGTVWDTGGHILGDDICAHLRATGWEVTAKPQ